MTHEAIERLVVDVRRESAFNPDALADKMDEPVMPPAPSAQNTPAEADSRDERRPVLAVAT